MTQHNLTQILKVIRDLVMRNRPCYRDYLGSETVTKTVQIGAGVFEGFKNGAKAQFIATDSSFTGFVLGETYAVTIDGVTEDYVARNLYPISDEVGPFIGTTTTFNTENGMFDGWFCFASPTSSELFGCLVQTHDTSFIGKTISISQTKTETVTRYNTKLLPEYLLPAFLRKNVVASKTEVQSAADKAIAAKNVAYNAQTKANDAQTEASTALTRANNAQATANAAKTTAETAKTTADAAKTTAETTANECVKKSNTRQFGINLGSNNSFSGSVQSSEVKYSFMTNDITDTPTNLSIGTFGGTALTISVTPSRSPTVKITPPVYGATQANIEFAAITKGYPAPQITGLGGITMCSSTPASTKKFKITVDDTGTLKATEVT